MNLLNCCAYSLLSIIGLGGSHTVSGNINNGAFVFSQEKLYKVYNIRCSDTAGFGTNVNFVRPPFILIRLIRTSSASRESGIGLIKLDTCSDFFFHFATTA